MKSEIFLPTDARADNETIAGISQGKVIIVEPGKQVIYRICLTITAFGASQGVVGDQAK
jgi:hypothetical protein